MTKWAKGTYQVKNPAKYIGKQLPIYRSSWELKFCAFCDEHPSIVKWASENIKIPYFNPLTNRRANYIPDFLIEYIDKNGNYHTELIEIKPSSQTTLESAGRSKRNKAAVILNSAKWQAAQEWCEAQGIRFKVMTEEQMFHTNGYTPRRRRR